MHIGGGIYQRLGAGCKRSHGRTCTIEQRERNRVAQGAGVDARGGVVERILDGWQRERGRVVAGEKKQVDRTRAAHLAIHHLNLHRVGALLHTPAGQVGQEWGGGHAHIALTHKAQLQRYRLGGSGGGAVDIGCEAVVANCPGKGGRRAVGERTRGDGNRQRLENAVRLTWKAIENEARRLNRNDARSGGKDVRAQFADVVGAPVELRLCRTLLDLAFSPEVRELGRFVVGLPHQHAG